MPIHFTPFPNLLRGQSIFLFGIPINPLVAITCWYHITVVCNKCCRIFLSYNVQEFRPFFFFFCKTFKGKLVTVPKKICTRKYQATTYISSTSKALTWVAHVHVTIKALLIVIQPFCINHLFCFFLSLSTNYRKQKCVRLLYFAWH